MNTHALKLKLDLLAIAPTSYSLNGDLKLDCIVLFYNYSEWNLFYLDEKGFRYDEITFTSESDACEYMYNIFKGAKDIEAKFGIKTI